MYFLKWKLFNFKSNFIEICSFGYNWRYVSTLSDNGLAPNRQQAITSSNDPVHSYVSPSLNELIHTENYQYLILWSQVSHSVIIIHILKQLQYICMCEYINKCFESPLAEMLLFMRLYKTLKKIYAYLMIYLIYRNVNRMKVIPTHDI